MHIDKIPFLIVVAVFVLVTCTGFAAARWRPAEDPMRLSEWGLGGRGFGTFISWFLLGGDVYTAYTFIAVPALVYATGAAGFYALSYTIMVFPVVFIFAPRLWSVARARGYVSPGEFVRGRHGSQGLGLAVALTGILATMPYIALQLVGIESVLTVMGIGSNSDNIIIRDLPLIIAFGLTSAYTYLAGLRAVALTAFIKDTLIYVTVIVAILYIPARLGGWGHVFNLATAHLNTADPATGKPYGSLVVLPAGQWAYATLALGSALALFVYPHAATGVLAAKRRNVIRRNAAMLPAYTLILGLIALFGYLARAVPAVNAGVKAGGGNDQLAVPLLFEHMFPGWFAGIGYSAIIIGALVPAAIMSIAAANLFTRTIYRELIRPYATPAQETRVARLASLLMKVGALAFVLELNRTFSINLQLLGGIWILQTFPAVVIGLYTRWFHRYALITGWAVAMTYGTLQAYRTPGGGQSHFGGSAAPLFGHVTYIAITALILNLAVSTLFTVVFRSAGVQDGYDETKPSDYIADPAPASTPRPTANDPATNDATANGPAIHGARHRAARTAGLPRSSHRPGPPG
jgi:SSS family solute:Na+ symporter